MESKPHEPGLGVPLTVGIIGHRDLLVQERQRVQSQIREIVSYYRKTFPDCPILVMSSLAQGADQLALAAVSGLEGVRVLALLPMSFEEYAADFDEDGLAELSRYFSAADLVATVDQISGSADMRQVDAERNNRYQRCARLLSRNSHVLIAVWDGRPPLLVAGTSETVHERCGSRLTLDSSEDVRIWPDERGITLVVPAGRESHGQRGLTPDGHPADNRILAVEPSLAYRAWEGKDEDEVPCHLAYLNQAAKEQDFPVRAMESATTLVMHVADTQAARLQRRFRRFARAVLGSGVGFLLTVNLEQSLGQAWLTMSAVLMLVVTGVLWWLLARSELNDRYQQWRALAEGARVQVSWLKVGVSSCPSDSYLLAQPDVSWIRRVLRSAWIQDRVGSLEHHGSGIRDDAADQAPEATANWIDGQLRYFHGASGYPGAIARNRRYAQRYRWISISGLVVAGAALGLDLAYRAGATVNPALGSQLLWEAGLGVAAASAAYAQLMAYTEIARQLDSAAMVFAQGQRELDRPSGRERARQIAEFIGLAALTETSTWLALKRDRSVRPV